MLHDITCSHCGEPTDATELRTDSIGYLDDHQGPMLAPLGSVTDVIAHLRELGETDGAALAAELTSAQELPARVEDITLPMLFDFYWAATLYRDATEPCMAAAVRIVQTALYRGTLTGQGCTHCGFQHEGVGEFRGRTLHDLVFSGVNDVDPALYLTTEELTQG